MRRNSKAPIVVFLLFGIIFLIVSFVVKAMISSNTKGCNMQTEAIVVDLIEKENDGDILYAPVYDYYIGDRSFRAESNVSSTSHPSIGDTVTIYYDSTDPTRCYIDGEYTVFSIIATVFMCLGILFLVIVVLIIIKLVLTVGLVAFLASKTTQDINSQQINFSNQQTGFGQQTGFNNQQMYQCPYCGAQIAYGVTSCPNCRNFINWG